MTYDSITKPIQVRVPLCHRLTVWWPPEPSRRVYPQTSDVYWWCWSAGPPHQNPPAWRHHAPTATHWPLNEKANTSVVHTHMDYECYSRPAHPQMLFSVLQTVCVHIFRFFCGCATNLSRQKSNKGQCFFHLSCKQSAWTNIFKYNLHGCTVKLAGIHWHLSAFLSKQNTMCVWISMVKNT